MVVPNISISSFYFIRDQVSRGTIKLEYYPTDQMIADILTKGLTGEAFCKLREKSGILELQLQ